MKHRGFIYCGSSVLSVRWSFLAHKTQVEGVFIEQEKKNAFQGEIDQWVI